MLLTMPDNVPQNTPGTVRLQVVDPDTGATIPSNIAQQIAAIDPTRSRQARVRHRRPERRAVLHPGQTLAVQYVSPQ